MNGSLYAYSSYAIPTALTTLLMLTFGLRVLLRRVSRVSAAFFALTFCASIWLFAFTLMYLAVRPDAALFWARIAYLGVPILPAAVYHFATEMLHIVRKRRVAIADEEDVRHRVDDFLRRERRRDRHELIAMHGVRDDDDESEEGEIAEWINGNPVFRKEIDAADVRDAERRHQ